jgi:hypothetical protein
VTSVCDGPPGRRAGLISEPDVSGSRDVARRPRSAADPAAGLASDGVVARPQIDAALAYPRPRRRARHGPQLRRPSLRGGGASGYAENVGDSTPLAAEHSIAGSRHHGLVLVLASPLSRRPQGLSSLIAAIEPRGKADLADRRPHPSRFITPSSEFRTCTTPFHITTARASTAHARLAASGTRTARRRATTARVRLHQQR